MSSMKVIHMRSINHNYILAHAKPWHFAVIVTDAISLMVLKKFNVVGFINLMRCTKQIYNYQWKAGWSKPAAWTMFNWQCLNLSFTIVLKHEKRSFELCLVYFEL